MTDRTDKEIPNDVAQSKTKEDAYGLCPRCEGVPEYRNIDRTQWAYCRDCKTKWVLGVGLFSSFRSESPEIWLEALAMLTAFEEVEPLYLDESDPRKMASPRVTSIRKGGRYCHKRLLENIVNDAMRRMPHDIQELRWRLCSEVAEKYMEALKHNGQHVVVFGEPGTEPPSE